MIEPATEAVLEQIPRAGVAEVDEAVAAARAALPAWRALEPGARAGRLRELADALEQHAEELAVLEARNAGKPIGDARGEMAMVVDTFRYYAGAPERLLGDTIPVAGGQAWTVREPLGVVGLITPWNFPLAIASWKLAPALAAGNTVVLKPAELTPLTALRFAEIALEAGIAPGVVNVVVGPGSVCGARLVEHPDVAKIAFTGSTEVGRSIAAGAAQTIKRVTLELGGKSANVIFADADLEAAAAAAPMAVFGNSGQDCCARSRILVQEGAVDRFMELLAEAVQAIVVGQPLDEATQMGPLISAAQRESVGSFLRGAGAGRDPRQRARRARLLVRADRARARRAGLARRARGDLRADRGGDRVLRRGRGGAPGQRHDLRAVGIGLDARRSARAADDAGDRDRRDLGQLEHVGPREHAVRRLQAVRLRARARAARARGLHRDEDDLLRDGMTRIGVVSG